MKFRIPRTKNLVLGVIILLLLVVIAMFAGKNPKYIPDNDTTSNRIYIDIATTPALLQAYDLANLPQNPKKFVAWARNKNLKDNLKNNSDNITVLNFKESTNPDYDPVFEYYEKHPDTKFIIHVNLLHQAKLLKTLLYRIPPENIKEIHLYEDSLYRIEWDKGIYSLFDDIVFISLKPYNLVIHFKNADKYSSPFAILQPKYWHVKQQIHNIRITDIDFNEIKEQINNDPKFREKFYKIIDFDYEKYKKIIKHPSFLYIFGHMPIDKPTKKIKEQTKFLKRITNNDLDKELEGKNIHWYYKQHPEIINAYSYTNDMNKEFRDFIEIEKHLPTEILFLSDLSPDYIAGYSSSVFFSIPKQTKIYAYVKRKSDPYLEILLKNKIIDEKIIYTYE